MSEPSTPSVSWWQTNGVSSLGAGGTWPKAERPRQPKTKTRMTLSDATFPKEPYPYKQSFNLHLFCVSMTSCGSSSSKTVSKKFSNIKKLSGMTSDNSILKKTWKRMPDPCNSGCESVLFKESHAKWKDKIQVSFYVLFKWIDALYNPKIQQLWAFPLYYLTLMVLMMSFLSLSRLSKWKNSDSPSQDIKSSQKN